MDRTYFIDRARELKPVLKHKTMLPQRRVHPVADSTAFIGYRMEEEAGKLLGDPMHSGDCICWDFGEHMVGKITLKLSLAGTRQDSPVRINLKFGEMPDEIAKDYAEYAGWLSTAWLQTETFTIDELPCELELPRRYAFRYLKLEVCATSIRFGINVDAVSCDATTSADDIRVSASDDLEGRIRQVSLRTLRDCMQYFFEDGPKRDRRLWIGDLRLQALANHATFRNLDLVKRSLYMFAAAQLPSGWLPAAVYDTDPPLDDEAVMVDYALLFGVTVRDLLRRYDETAFADELYPICYRQAALAHERLRADGTFELKEGETFFIDWNDELNRDAASLGIYMYGLKALSEIAEKLGKAEDVLELNGWIASARGLAVERFWDRARQRFICDGQESMASQIWMLLSGVPDRNNAESLIRSILDRPPEINVVTPYLKHYFVEAMWEYGFREEARKVISDYWGRMVLEGADTFWEVFIPDRPDASPYGGTLTHSRCHAWSCTPLVFLCEQS